MWGQENTVFEEENAERIIPTRVGTSIREDEIKMLTRDHPHACGDKYFCQVRHRHVVGSSPRVWGQASWCGGSMKQRRIIPTRVGTRCICCVDCAFTQDHPHACGDKMAMKPFCGYHMGSSPRVWGQAVFQSLSSFPPRIIPTRVGTSYNQNYNTYPQGDHPHACGDKLNSFA